MPAEGSAYLTDDSRLYRVVSGFTHPPEVTHPPEESCAALEDCATLEVTSYSPDELWTMGLRLVGRAAPTAAGIGIGWPR